MLEIALKVVLLVLGSNMASRYKLTDIIRFKGQTTYGLFKSLSWIDNAIVDNISSFTVTTDLEGRPDLISNALYGTQDYYWVLILLNKPLDPLNWPKTGQIIKTLSSAIIRINT